MGTSFAPTLNHAVLIAGDGRVVAGDTADGAITYSELFLGISMWFNSIDCAVVPLWLETYARVVEAENKIRGALLL